MTASEFLTKLETIEDDIMHIKSWDSIGYRLDQSNEDKYIQLTKECEELLKNRYDEIKNENVFLNLSIDDIFKFIEEQPKLKEYVTKKREGCLQYNGRVKPCDENVIAVYKGNVACMFCPGKKFINAFVERDATSPRDGIGANYIQTAVITLTPFNANIYVDNVGLQDYPFAYFNKESFREDWLNFVVDHQKTEKDKIVFFENFKRNITDKETGSVVSRYRKTCSRSNISSKHT